MRTKIIEATQDLGKGPNHGKFLLGKMDVDDWAYQSRVAPIFTLLGYCGWTPKHVWVLDLQTGEGAFFRIGGYAKADLNKHKIWVCPMFEPFLQWLYDQKFTELDELPDLVELPQAEFSMHGYRRNG
jgi:hypothetical protein